MLYMMRVRALRTAIVIVAGVACGGPQELGARGDSCFRTADCREGLVCIENACTNDISGRVPDPYMPPGEEVDASADAAGDGAIDIDATLPPADAPIGGAGGVPPDAAMGGAPPDAMGSGGIAGAGGMAGAGGASGAGGSGGAVVDAGGAGGPGDATP